ncbi:efflux transporter, RND family, MFP subunit [Synechococcus sp. PCC 7335]|uniref:efflux RND transporter periplasmic adaptor subunit n=1 Tax=Synechococcus sp. (strain ATCC 29403 / PCC 7335) TaxID=91464 RepID=UPI00017EC429|nr:efflux RND transporter periplasmic adaptor subunit [Synechococcus sp. PCC 7335]EDX86427.1 efflux transporter, RND family, MFP subunit [Synechococcus sp. PCC 7335]
MLAENKISSQSPQRSWLSPFVLGTALSISLLSLGCRRTPDADVVSPGIPAQVEELASDTVRDSTTFVGTLEAVEIVDVRSEIQGRIETVFVSPGEFVGPGQSIVSLRPDQTAPQYEGDLAGVEVARTNLASARAQLGIAQAQRTNALSELNVATEYEPRLRTLYEQGAIAELRLDEGLLEVEAAKNNFAAAEEKVTAAQSAIIQAESSIRQAQARADASLVSFQSKEVVSPISGVVGDLNVKRGEYIGTGDQIVQITQTENLVLNLQVPSTRSSQLKEGLTVQLIDPATDELLTNGTVDFISPTVNSEGQTILVKALFNNVGRKLKDSQYVEAKVIWNTEPGLLIPSAAISRSGSKNFVYVVGEEPNESGQEIVNLKPVELGDIQGGRYRVMSGLEEGDRIAVSNILKLQDGAPIVPEVVSKQPFTESEANSEVDSSADSAQRDTNS